MRELGKKKINYFYIGHARVHFYGEEKLMIVVSFHFVVFAINHITKGFYYQNVVCAHFVLTVTAENSPTTFATNQPTKHI